MKVSCPKCNGKIEAEIPGAFLRCGFCGSSLFIDIDTVTPVYSFEPRIHPDELTGYLKRDFEKLGFDELIEVCGVAPYFIPFWQVEGRERLERASAYFPNDTAAKPSGSRVFFSDTDIAEKGIEVLSIDTQPAGDKTRTLYYLPFFETEISFNEGHYTFYVSAADGAVYGEPIPFISPERSSRLFYLFIGLFLALTGILALVGNMLISFILCCLAAYIFHGWVIKALPGDNKKEKT